MKLIFLDVDGVLNHELFYKKRAEEGKLHKEVPDHLWGINQIDPQSVESINFIIEKTGAKVVLSSSWRAGRWLPQMQTLMEAVGFKGEIIGYTPRLEYGNVVDLEGPAFAQIEDYTYSVPRGCEIKAWMEMNKDILGDKMSKVRYVIFDDDSDMLYWQRNNFIQTDAWCGITPQQARKAIHILNY